MLKANSVHIEFHICAFQSSFINVLLTSETDKAEEEIDLSKDKFLIEWAPMAEALEKVSQKAKATESQLKAMWERRDKNNVSSLK